MHLYTPMPASCSDLQALWIVPIFNSPKKNLNKYPCCYKWACSESTECDSLKPAAMGAIHKSLL